MKNTIKPFFLNVDFNKLEKGTLLQTDDPSGIYFKIKIRQTKNIFIDMNAPNNLSSDSNLKKHSQLENTAKTRFQILEIINLYHVRHSV
jgi:hypothetical protein